MSEKLNFRVTFDVFQERLKNYVLKSFNQAEDVIILITNLFDSNAEFEAQNKPDYLSTTKQENLMRMEQWKIRYKQFIIREEILQENITKIYGLIIGQCTPTLRSALKADKDFKPKSEIFEALWLMKSIKTVSSGVDIKANPALTLHEQLLTFLTMRQRQNESDDDYLVRFNSQYQSLKMSGSAHVICSPKLFNKAIHRADPDQVEKEAKRFKAMCFLLRANESRYKDFLEEVKKGAPKGQDEYPMTVADAYQLLLRTSKLIGYKKSQRFGQ